ncbi:MAG TPA: squalene--hopene cyclase [Candidatus Acidoferrales bacterium]|nr:squalene--hopene cyclase [Candidatus Acidoferrales bacterium]
MATGTSTGLTGMPISSMPQAAATVLTSSTIEARLARAIERGAQHLLSLQAREGFWNGELEADTTLESDYIYYLHVLGKAEPERIAKLANYVRERQLEDGGWNIYFGGPSELNASVKAYFALRLAGDSAAAPQMIRARNRIHELGGLEATNSYTRFYFALVGLVGWDMVPAIPPELMLLPSWFYLNIYEMSSWTRGIVIPLVILYALKPRWSVGKDIRVDELFKTPGRAATSFDWDPQLFSWRNFFLAADRAYKLYDRFAPWKPLRGRAMEQAREWLLEHLERSEGLATIYPAMMNEIFALVAMGKGLNDPLTAREFAEFSKFEIEDRSSMRVVPCVSPVWDTCIAMVALEEAGLPPNHPALVQAASWLLEKQITGRGDWQVKNRDAEPGGWAFEFRNDWYPDVDDTAFVLMALQRVDYPDKPRMDAAIKRGVQWLLSMQNRDGGWGAFDRDNDKQMLTKIPFADHNAVIDPATADVTARVVECLGRMGWSGNHPAIRRAEEFLKRDQRPDGSWFGRWGVNYIYGTGGVLRALEAVGLAARDYAQRARAWLGSVQNSDGGYGESIASYYDESLKAKAASTASQTAWALIGLMASGGEKDPSTERAVNYLVNRQNFDGSWDEADFTGTGFPKVFYLKYHLYRNYFPVYALSRYRNVLEGKGEFHAVEFNPADFRHRN